MNQYHWQVRFGDGDLAVAAEDRLAFAIFEIGAHDQHAGAGRPGLGEKLVAANRSMIVCNAHSALGAASDLGRILFSRFHVYSPSKSPFEMPAPAAHSAAGILPAPDGRTRLIRIRPPTH